MTSKNEHLAVEIERIVKGGPEKYHARNREQQKLFARDRLKLLLDDGKIEFEDGMFAECQNPELPADGSITGVGRIHGRPVAFTASHSTVKAGTAGEGMGGARRDCTVSGLGDFRVQSEEEAIALTRNYLRYTAQNYLERPADVEPVPPSSDRPLRDIVPEVQSKPFNMYEFIDALV